MSFVYPDQVRNDILRLTPADGTVIGSIGCGTAATEAELARQGRQVHGVDILPEAIVVAKGRLASARVVSPDDRQPFAPNSLDGLILADVIEHIPRAWEALAAFAMAVKPGGWVIISVPNMRGIDAVWQFIVRGDWPEDEMGIFDATHVQVMTQRRLERWCAKAGLRIEEQLDNESPLRPRRNKLRRIIDRVTFGAFHSWFQYQLIVRCRREPLHGSVAQ